MTQNLTCEWITPPNLGWLLYSLGDKEIDYLWNCIGEGNKEKVNAHLAGNINSSFPLYDKNEWFFKHTLCPLIRAYGDQFEDIGNNLPVLHAHPYTLKRWWVNYQKQHDFNPPHDHTGVYSFVIWLKIPTEHAEQNKDNITNSPVRSNFQFHYQNILGEIMPFNYELGKNYEGKMLFFPSKLRHEVFPFYNCDEDRISISGNICIDETIEL